jgi:hypothetical protein
MVGEGQSLELRLPFLSYCQLSKAVVLLRADIDKHLDPAGMDKMRLNYHRTSLEAALVSLDYFYAPKFTKPLAEHTLSTCRLPLVRKRKAGDAVIGLDDSCGEEDEARD